MIRRAFDRLAAVCAFALLGIGRVGCATSEVQAKFVASESCSWERVHVTQIGSVDPPPVKISPPPVDIAADPARAAIYYQTRRAELNTTRRSAQRVFLAEGCGRRETYVCDFSDGESSWCERDLSVRPSK